jgi:hypothetical protein
MRTTAHFRSDLSGYMVDERLAWVDALLHRPNLTTEQRARLEAMHNLLAEDSRLRRAHDREKLGKVETLLRWTDRGADITHIVMH